MQTNFQKMSLANLETGVTCPNMVHSITGSGYVTAIAPLLSSSGANIEIIIDGVSRGYLRYISDAGRVIYPCFARFTTSLIIKQSQTAANAVTLWYVLD